MATPDDTQNVEITRPRTAVPRPAAIPSEQRGRSLPPVIEQESRWAQPVTTTRGRAWSLALLVAGAGILAGVMFTYLFAPAVATLADPSATRWSGEGP